MMSVNATTSNALARRNTKVSAPRWNVSSSGWATASQVAASSSRNANASDLAVIPRWGEAGVAITGAKRTASAAANGFGRA